MGICVSCRRRDRKAPEKRAPGPGGGRGLPKGAAAELLPRRARAGVDRAMANSISNIKMTNPIKGFVSKRRIRYMKDGFNLDLAYITDRLIAMGFPAEKLEGVYRNHIDEVYRFLEQMHKDHYRIYNLCSERSYDSSKFHGRVVRYAFDDHAPPNIELIKPFCEDVHSWLSADSRNVAAVHCKAGKGRTGTMVSCYLLYSGQKATADEALTFYGTKRTLDHKGVTIPSQRRYVEYFAALMRTDLQYTATKLHIRELVMSPPPTSNGGQCALELTVSQAQPPLQAPGGCGETRRGSGEACVRVALAQCTPLGGDVRVDVWTRHKMMRGKEKLFHFWFNTFFVARGVGAVRVPSPPDSTDLDTFKLTLNKWQLDVAHKDTHNKLYNADFKVELIVQKQPDSSTFRGHGLPPPAPSPPSSSDSSCSEPDTEPDSHWDSGEPLAVPYTRLRSQQPYKCESRDCTPGSCNPRGSERDYRPPQEPYKCDSRDFRPGSCKPTECTPDSRHFKPISSECKCHYRPLERPDSYWDSGERPAAPYNRLTPSREPYGSDCNVTGSKAASGEFKCGYMPPEEPCTLTRDDRDSRSSSCNFGDSSPGYSQCKCDYELTDSKTHPVECKHALKDCYTLLPRPCFKDIVDCKYSFKDLRPGSIEYNPRESGSDSVTCKDVHARPSDHGSPQEPSASTYSSLHSVESKSAVCPRLSDPTDVRNSGAGRLVRLSDPTVGMHVVECKSATFALLSKPGACNVGTKSQGRSTRLSDPTDLCLCCGHPKTRQDDDASLCYGNGTSNGRRSDACYGKNGDTRLSDVSDAFCGGPYRARVSDAADVATNETTHGRLSDATTVCFDDETTRLSDSTNLSDPDLCYDTKDDTNPSFFARHTQSMQPEAKTKERKNTSKRSDENKGKIPKVSSDHTIADETRKKYTFFHRRDEDGLTRPRLSLGDVRASLREFSGKFGSESRKKKDKNDAS